MIIFESLNLFLKISNFILKNCNLLMPIITNKLEVLNSVIIFNGVRVPNGL